MNAGQTIAAILMAFAVLLGPPRACAQRSDAESVLDAVQDMFNRVWVPRSRLTNGPHVRSAFREVVSEVRDAVVELRRDGKRVALGGVVGPDGWVVTKASLLKGPVTCRLRDGREFDTRVVGVDRDLDLAALKIEAKGLVALDLPDGTPPKVGERLVSLRTTPTDGAAPSDAVGPESSEASDNSAGPVTSTALQPGDWLATVGLGADPIAVGVASVLPRPIPKRRGFLGVGMASDEEQSVDPREGVLIKTVQGAAEEAGVLPGDWIVSVDGAETRSRKDLVDAIGKRNPGDRIELVVERGDETLRLLPMLRGWQPTLAEMRAYRQNQLGGELSERRFGFSSVLQHDTVLRPDQCGGPVVDLEGRVVGFNIARAGRTESYALPAPIVRSRLYDLMSGRLAPADAN